MLQDHELMYNDEIVCPLCGEKISDESILEFENIEDGEETDCTCQCGFEFRAMMRITYTYDSYVPDDKEQDNG